MNEVLLDAALFSLGLTARMGTVMFLSLFGVEVLMQMGAMRRLEPLARPLARVSRLPSESALTFLTALGSLVTANTMLAQFHQDGRITDRELLVSAVLNAVPLHFKETITFQLPVALPLLGVKLCLIYVGTLWLAGFMKLAFVVIYGRFRITPRGEARNAFDDMVCDPEKRECVQRTFPQILRDALKARRKLFQRMLIILLSVTFVVQILNGSGALEAFSALVAPLSQLFGLPSAVVAPLSVYILHSTVGLTSIAALLHDGVLTEYQTILTLLAGGFIMIPIARLKGTLPRYSGIFGFRMGASICGTTTTISLLARAIATALVIAFFR